MLKLPFSREKYYRYALSDYLGFVYRGYDCCVEWLEYTEELSPDKDIWPREIDIPSIDQLRMVQVQKPFNEDINEEFWTLFQPGYSSLNGWEDYPEEIDSSAFIRCRYVSSIRVLSHCAWIQVQVMEVIPLSQVEQTFIAEPEAGCFLQKLYSFDDSNLLWYKDWLYYYGNDQSNLGNWMLIQLIDHRAHLIAFGEWDFEQNTAYVGNLILSPSTCDVLFNQCNRPDLIGLII